MLFIPYKTAEIYSSTVFLFARLFQKKIVHLQSNFGTKKGLFCAKNKK